MGSGKVKSSKGELKARAGCWGIIRVSTRGGRIAKCVYGSSPVRDVRTVGQRKVNVPVRGQPNAECESLRWNEVDTLAEGHGQIG